MPLKHLVKYDTLEQGGANPMPSTIAEASTPLPDRSASGAITLIAPFSYPQVPVTLVGSRSAARLTRSRTSSSVIACGAGNGTTGGQLVCDLSDTGSPGCSVIDLP